MTVKLRGHHLLCLLGYRGMGYSAEFCANMTSIYERLRQQPEQSVELVEGPDEICRAYPEDKTNHCRGTVGNRDREVLLRLGLAPGWRGSWGEITVLLKERIHPDDVGVICEGCPWEPYGVCRDGVRLVREDLPLPAVER